MQLPQPVNTVFSRLEIAGFACHIVGGCVRDCLLGRSPHDWDLTTDALPEQVAALFADFRVIPTGMAHGTVTVVVDDLPLEITTYRTEGTYADHRRPDSVQFVPHIEEDLKRRDFTVNAMAWNPTTGLCDPYGGREDLQRRRLRCVGDAKVRFQEDALRILRALRFAATYGFAIEAPTAEALFASASLLREVAAERIQAEWNRLLVGKYACDVLRRFAPVVYPVLPELQSMNGVWQYNPYHDKDVWEHTLAAMQAAPPVLTVQLALLLHDIAKPFCFEWITPEQQFGHFPDHPARGAQMAESILQRLRYDRRTIERVCCLIRHHDDPVPDTDAGVRRWLSRLGEEGFRQLLDVKEGDCDGHAANLPPVRKEELHRVRERLTRVIAEKQCYSLEHLAVNGEQLLAAGVPQGKLVGYGLRWALDAVLDGTLPNEHDTLLSAILTQIT